MLLRSLKIFLVLTLSLSLAACIGAVYTGADSVYNHFSVENSINNHMVELSAINALNSQKNITQNSNISVTTVNFVILLTGSAHTNAVRQQAVSLVQNINGVRRVVNAIMVGNPPSETQSMHDSWITTKIKSKMLLNANLDSPAIKVVTTNNGMVFLMGAVTPNMANIAITIAKNTAEVRKVISLFQLITVSNT